MDSKALSHVVSNHMLPVHRSEDIFIGVSLIKDSIDQFRRKDPFVYRLGF